MWPRLLFWLVTAFFISMNVLLWRSEFGGRNNLGRVPVGTVWQKMLIAPDSSHLEIRHHGKKIGYATWAPKVTEYLPNPEELLDEQPPEGMILETSGYTIEFASHFSIDASTRLRFGFDLRLATNFNWQEISLHVGMRPSAWDIHVSAAKGTLVFTANDDTGRSEQVFKLADLQNPGKIFAQTGWPLNPALLGALGLPANPAATPLALGLNWEARNDGLEIAGERMRVYRLQARLLDRFQIALFVSVEGEILRVELPDEIVLVNDQLSIF